MATTLVGLATRIAAKIAVYTYAFLVNHKDGLKTSEHSNRTTLI